MAIGKPLQNKIKTEQDFFLRNVLLYQGAGIILGLGIIPTPLIYLGVFIVTGLMIFRITQKRLEGAILMLLILHFLQPYIRTYVSNLPYFYVELNTIIFVLLYLREFATQTVTELRVVLTLITVYFFIELASYSEYTELLYYRAIIGNSLALTLLVYAGVKRTKVHIPLDKIVNVLLLGGSLLGGVILSAHLRGNIEYGSESNFEASNGMGPVQLSFYLAMTAFLFFYRFFNESESSKKMFFAIQMLLIAGLSALTFSRGGLYFLAAYMGFYLLFNGHKFSKSKNSAYIALVFIPMLYFAYTTVLKITDNKVTDRFNEEGTGNRELLIDYGLIIFQENPAFGIGTSGFYEYISQARFFGSRTGSHNEFIRALAEHGIVGGVIYFGFILVAFSGIRQRRLPLDQKAIYYIFMFSYIAGVIHNGQKIGLQCFMVFLAISPLTSSAFKSDPMAAFKPKEFRPLKKQATELN